MKIGVVSDTHISGKDCILPDKLVSVFKSCDMIIHAGDVLDLCVIDYLKKISKVEAVRGNMDTGATREALPEKRIIKVEGKTLCIMHGYGHPKNLIETLKNEFSDEKPDIIVFGHSHKPANELIKGVLFFNPGSATDTIFTPYCSFGTIEVTKKDIKGEIHKL
ncbi:MAG: metallophosphoesterase family protein [Candidatus Omnitrophota bacterium]